MNKIIQFLRLSRLVLLVILLLFAVVAKIARAETAVLYKGSYGSSECKAFSSPDPQAVFNVCFPGAERQGWGLHKHPTREYYYVVGPNANTEYQSIVGVLKTCDVKELTHNGVSDGVETPPWLHWMRAPSGIDAADWYSDRFTSCENNCIVVNQRVPFSSEENRGKKSITEGDGTSRSAFLKTQTGSVCVVEKKKPDDPPKPPPPDNGDSTDGNGQSGAGSDSGNGTGSNDQSGSGSQGDGGQSSNSGSGNSNEGGSSSGGSGGGSGGVNGSGGQTGPSGGGTSGGESGGDQAEGSEGEAGGESDGSGEESGGSGDSGGEGGTDSGSQGNVGGTEGGQSGSQNGDSGGEGNGDGKGSIGGGSCEADTPPDCKGDPIQCYIAREQWRTACAASGKSNKIEGQGNCEQLTPPECKGDETQCYIAKQQFISACEAQAQHEARNSLKEYADGKSEIISDVESSSEDGVKSALDGNSTALDLTSLINRSGYGWSRSCPASAIIDAGVFGTFEIDNSMLCTMAQVLGKIFAALCMLFAVRYIFA